MYKRIYLVSVLLLSIFGICEATESPSISNDLSSRHVLSIPVYPGTKLFGREHSNLNKPFATILRVYKTKDGASFDAEKVISFFNSYYRKRGWQPAIFARRRNEPYLGLSTTVYEQGGEYANIHVAAEFYLWLAPKDGMLTVYMHQWRISSLTTKSLTSFTKLESILNSISKKYSYYTQKAVTYGDWPRYYQNEFLVDAKVFLVTKAGSALSRHLTLKGHFRIVILAYKDPQAATAQAIVFTEYDRKQWASTRSIIRNRNILVLIESGDKTHDALVANLTEELKLAGGS